jgi:hypothetical protein
VLKEWGRCECCLTDCRDRKTGSRCYRRIGFWWHHLLGLVSQARADQAESRGRQQRQPQGKLPGEARTPLGGSPARLAADAARAKESCRGDRRIRGVSPLLARTGSWCGSEPQGAST